MPHNGPCLAWHITHPGQLATSPPPLLYSSSHTHTWLKGVNFGLTDCARARERKREREGGRETCRHVAPNELFPLLRIAACRKMSSKSIFTHSASYLGLHVVTYPAAPRPPSVYPPTYALCFSCLPLCLLADPSAFAALTTLLLVPASKPRRHRVYHTISFILVDLPSAACLTARLPVKKSLKSMFNTI